MHTYQSLRFVRVLPRPDGIFAFAKFPNWVSEYRFLIDPAGSIKGQTDAGEWVELSNEFGSFVNQEVKSILRDESSRVYS